MFPLPPGASARPTEPAPEGAAGPPRPETARPLDRPPVLVPQVTPEPGATSAPLSSEAPQRVPPLAAPRPPIPPSPPSPPGGDVPKDWKAALLNRMGHLPLAKSRLEKAEFRYEAQPERLRIILASELDLPLVRPDAAKIETMAHHLVNRPLRVEWEALSLQESKAAASAAPEGFDSQVELIKEVFRGQVIRRGPQGGKGK